MSQGASSPGRVIRHAMNLRSDLAAGEAFALLAASGLDAILLRGPAIARRLYREGERRYSDVDLLVRERDRAGVHELLGGAGYVAFSTSGHEQHWRRPSDGCVIDLHVSLWGVTGRPSALWNALAARRETITLGSFEVVVPDAAGTAFVVALHASQHGALVGHVRTDLGRALRRFDRDVWAGAAACAEQTGSELAFRQGLTMLPAGRSRLAELGLEQASTRQSALRRDGVELPAYLLESLTLRERLALVGSRIAPPRAEIAAFVEPRAADSTAWLLAAHARRLVRLPARTARLAVRWRRAG